jgi:hypothetical protein
MSTLSTSQSWFWYIRKRGKNWVLGLVDGDGEPPSTADLDIEYWYDEVPDEITSDDDEIPIPAEYEHALAMGCVYEILRINGEKFRLSDMRRDRWGNLVPSPLADFNDGIYNAIHQQTKASQQPLRIAPYNIRMDELQVGRDAPEK